MQTKAYRTILAVIALMLFGAVGARAQTEQPYGARQPMQHDMSRMDMSSMMNEPHHALAMSYMQTIGTFARTLSNQAEGRSVLDADFARAAVAEIERSFDQMEEHHEKHVKSMSEEMRSQMATMMKDVEMHLEMLDKAISALEKDVRADHPDSKQVAADSANVLKHLDEMCEMHDDTKGMKM